MFDSISVLFILLSIYALYKGHHFLSGASISIAIATKIFPVMILPALVAYLAVKYKGDRRILLRHLTIMITGAAAMMVFIFIPQILDGTLMQSLDTFIGRVGRTVAFIPDETSSFSIWSFLFRFETYLYYIAIAVSMIYAYIMYKKTKENEDEALLTHAILIFAIVFTIPIVPQYLLVLLPFIIFFIVLFDKRFIVPFAFLSIGIFFYALLHPNYNLLLSSAAYTNLFDVSQILSMNAYMDAGLMLIISWFTGLIGAWLILLYWIRYKREARKDA